MHQKRGFIVIMLTMSVLILSFSSTLSFFTQAFGEYRKASNLANHTRAKYLAQSGIEGALLFINQLEKYGLFSQDQELPPIPLGDSQVQIKIEDISGKFNVNQLVNFFDTSLINNRQLDRLQRLSEHLKISPDLWDAVIDWIDEDNVPQPYGYERRHYESLIPARKIKNSWIHSLEELLLIPGFSRNLLFSDLRTLDEIQDFKDFLETEEEKYAIQKEDFILANNLSYQTGSQPNASNADWININKAPYLVILSLSEKITPEIAKAILVKRLELGELDEKTLKSVIPKVPEEMFRAGNEQNNELGTPIGIKYEGDIYTITTTVSIGNQSAQVVVTYDKARKAVISYSE